MIDDIYYQRDAHIVNHGLKINDVVQIKRKVFWGTITGKNYIIDRICNGLASIRDSDEILYLNGANNLTCVGHVEKCIQFKDKSLCLI